MFKKKINKKLEEVNNLSDEEILEREKELYVWSCKRVLLGGFLIGLGVLWFLLSK